MGPNLEKQENYEKIKQSVVNNMFGLGKTLKTLRKYEKEFAKEIEDLSTEKRKTLLESSKVASQVVSSYNKTI